LSAHPAVESVRYAGLDTDPNNARAKTYLPDGVAGPIMVTLKGGRPAAAHVIEKTADHFFHAVNVGDATKDMISHPWTTTHRQLSEEQKATIGIKQGSLRLTIAAESSGPAICSLARALKHCPA
jgi:O-acetylhomoserine (thiol)-lyase